MRVNHIHNSFISGEVTPKFYGRTDTNQYNQSCEEVTNMIIHPQGGASRRPGTIYKAQITKTDGSAPSQVRLFPFRGTDGSVWQIILTDEDVFNFTPHGISIAPAVTLSTAWRAVRCSDGVFENVYPSVREPELHGTATTDWPPISGLWDMTAKSVDLNEIQYCQAGDTMIFAHGNIRPFRIIYDSRYVGNTHSDFQTIPQNYGFTFLEFPSLNTLQSSAFDLSVVRAMPYQNPRTDAVFTVTSSGNPHGAGSAVACAVSVVLKTATLDIPSFDQSWVGRQLKFSKGSDTFGVVVRDVPNSTTLSGIAFSPENGDLLTATLTVAVDLSGGIDFGFAAGSVNDSSFELGFWNDTDGWPRTVCFFESRLVFGGNKKFPDTLWFSKLNNVFQFDQRGFEQEASFGTLPATAAFAQDMKEAAITKTRWLTPGKTILVGTDAAEFVVFGPDNSKTIALDNTFSSPETSLGVSVVQAIRYQNTTLFVQRDRKTLREVTFSLEENSYNAESLSILSEHIVNQYGMEREIAGYPGASLPGAIFAMTKQDVPNGIVWCLDNNGCLLGLTRERSQRIVAWHRHELGGGEGVITAGESLAVGKGSVEYKPTILSISAITSKPIDEYGLTSEPDDLWMAVRRQVGTAVGSNPEDSTWTDIVCLEMMAREWERPTINRGWGNSPITAPIYMDCAIFWDSVDNGKTGVIDIPYASVGDQISVLKDGYDIGEFTVNASRQINISAQLTAAELLGAEESDRWKAICGYNFIGRLAPVVPEVPTQVPGSSIGQTRRTDRLVIFFLRSLGVRFGIRSSTQEENTPLYELEEVQFPSDPDDATAPVPLYTGEQVLDFSEGYEKRPQMVIESYRPLPCTIPYIVAKQVVYES